MPDLGLQQPDAAEQAQLFQDIGPLPLQGKAWPTWIKILAVVVLVLIGLKIGQVAASPVGRNLSPMVSGSIVLCFAGLIVLARYMLVSQTRITEQGIEQSWLGKREVAWQDLQYAKFVPLVASKRLICFPRRGRPVIFQAGTRELQIAFARIALVYRRRR
ncbi:hypothetical protein [Allopusillimonas ginsengisoli]|uniref:hypothetical protein n=1 Tax=Allopusillimonas ginsengisoli TaxID=453575 RepID=UPI001020E103|nr:hypothetical protein [Allopusillimonas ginsengisoli]TEA78353.1 hypothetical protein ERE07_11170 [Allopusillimonas ginsengisoli]